MYEFYLDDNQPQAGGLRALTGNDTWTGAVTLIGATAFGA